MEGPEAVEGETNEATEGTNDDDESPPRPPPEPVRDAWRVVGRIPGRSARVFRGRRVAVAVRAVDVCATCGPWGTYCGMCSFSSLERDFNCGVSSSLPSGVPGVSARTAGHAGCPGVDPDVMENSIVVSDISFVVLEVVSRRSCEQLDAVMRRWGHVRSTRWVYG